MMLNTDKTVSRTVRLSRRVSVTITFGASGVVVEWDPEPMRLSKTEIKRYLAARNACASDMARLIDGPVVVADLKPGGLAGGLVFYPDGRVESV